MNNDEKLRKEIVQALGAEPILLGAELDVTVREGIVTLHGTVDSYAKKRIAEHAAKVVRGVRAVIERVEVSFTSTGNQTDQHIVREVLDALLCDRDVPNDKILVQVERGWVSLEGTVQWNAQRQAAVKCIESISGIRAIDNKIIIRSGTEDEVEKMDIQLALVQNKEIEECNIRVEVFGNSVTLQGDVPSMFQKDEAEKTAWNTPGVWNVHNELLVAYT